jgi:hypothetical protein
MVCRFLAGLGLLGLAGLCEAVHAADLGSKKMTRRYNNSGWVQMPYREFLPGDLQDQLLNPIHFVADGPEATIRFEADNFDSFGNWISNRFDSVVVVKWSTLLREDLWPSFSRFDFTLLPPDDPGIVFKDLFVDGTDPRWQGVGTPGSVDGTGASQQVFWVLWPGQSDSTLGLGRPSDPSEVATELTVSGLVPGEEYALAFLWHLSIVDPMIDAEFLGVTVTVTTPNLRDGVVQTGMIGDESDVWFWDEYYVDLPAGSTNLVVDLYDLTADADLQVFREGGAGECSSFWGGTHPDQCVFSAPEAGRWRVRVNNYQKGSPIFYTLRASWDGSPGFFPVTPCRVLDTRQEAGALASSVRRELQVPARCGIPFSARSVSANVTVVQPTAAGHLRLWPADAGSPPTTSVINFAAGQVRANNAILPLAADAELSGRITIEPFLLDGGTVHLLLDVNGFFQAADPPAGEMDR